MDHNNQASRRQFIKNAGTYSIALALPWSAPKNFTTADAPVTFGLVADAHQDIMHDATERLEQFVQATIDQSTSFNIQLGDFCEPKAANRDFLKVWNGYKGPKFHVLGNHDMDSSTKEVTMDFWEMPGNYYSFDHGGYHFVVLDANFLNLEGAFVPYSKANFYINDDHRTWINPVQIEWLKSDLESTDLPTIVFSHQGLAHEAFGVKNRRYVQMVLENANRQAGFQKVIACFNGHNHVDSHRQINDIHYIDINSLSYQWLGEKYQCFTRYPETLYRERPVLSKIAPYQDPLYAFITLTTGSLTITGIQSQYIGPSPEELGMPNGFYSIPYSAAISDRNIER